MIIKVEGPCPPPRRPCDDLYVCDILKRKERKRERAPSIYRRIDAIKPRRATAAGKRERSLAVAREKREVSPARALVRKGTLAPSHMFLRTSKGVCVFVCVSRKNKEEKKRGREVRGSFLAAESKEARKKRGE